MPLVTVVSEREHDYGSEDIGWCNQALRCSCAESHTILEDDRKEVGDGVGDGSGEHEERGKTPDLEVQCMLHVFSDGESFWNSVVSILLDPCNNEGNFLFVQELLAEALLCGVLREVDDEVPADKSNHDSEKALEDEDPSPSSETGAEAYRDGRVLLSGAVVNAHPFWHSTTVAGELRHPEGKDTREG